MRRSPLRRHPQRSPVSAELRAAVFARDRQCLLATMDSEHQCRDAWGTPHAPNDWSRLTIEHVKSELRMGRRAESDLRHCVALCGAANVGVPSKAQREAFRAYLAAVAS